jgi:hypothetical protein
MNKYLNLIEEKLDLYFGKKAPAMPENIKEAIVKYSPYLSIIVLLFTLPAILFAFGLSSLVMPFAYVNGIHTGFSFSITALISLASLVFEILAIPGLFKRTKQSWKLMFYASLLSLLSSLLSLSLGSLIIGGVVSFYILFQIRSYYKN